MISDSPGREFKTLRISLTESCNFSCLYCKGSDLSANSKSLKTSGFLDLVEKIHRIVNLETVRLTGGEPLIYRDIENLVCGLKSIGLSDIKMTTNGSLLSTKALILKKAGLTSVNVSLDALESQIYEFINGDKNPEAVLDGIQRAKEAGLEVKINCTVIEGSNDREILPVFEYFSDRNIPVRFLELMKMGHLHGNFGELYFSQKEILQQISKKYSLVEIMRERGSTARYWLTGDGRKFGIIANNSSPFCSDCNRLRMDSKGKIYGCISDPRGFDLKAPGVNPDNLESILSQALKQKQKSRFTGSVLSMMKIGG